jgi:hypothetical protein
LSSLFSLAACSTSQLGAVLEADEAQDGFRTLDPGLVVATRYAHSSVYVPRGATSVRVDVVGGHALEATLVDATWDPQPAGSCERTETGWSCVQDHPRPGMWQVELFNPDDLHTTVDVEWTIHGGGHQDARLVRRPVEGPGTLTLEVPDVMGHLVARLPEGEVTIDGTEVACGPATFCRIPFADGEHTVSWDGTGELSIDWVAAPLLLDRVFRLPENDGPGNAGIHPIAVPEGVETLRVEAGAAFVRVMRDGTTFCAAEDACEVDWPLAGEWVVQLTADSVTPGIRAGLLMQDAGMSSTDPTPPSHPSRAPGPHIAEVLADPTGQDITCDGYIHQAEDEFIELANDGGVAIDLTGWSLHDGHELRHAFAPGTVVPADGALVVTTTTSECWWTVQSPHQVASTGLLALNDNADTVRLVDPDGHEVDRLSWSSPGAPGIAMVVVDGQVVPHDVVSAMPTSPGERPDGSAYTPAPSPEIVINEVLADPPMGLAGDMNCDGLRHGIDDEFIELVNAGAHATDLSGWALHDGHAERFRFPSDTVLFPGQVVVVFGGGGSSCSFPAGVQAFSASGGLALSQDDSVELRDADGFVMDDLHYTEALGNQDRSMVRAVDGDPLADFVLHPLPAPASPGRRSDETPW